MDSVNRNVRAMVINTTSFVKDATLLIRDRLASNITDPIASGRSSESKFVLTAFPHKTVNLPHIVVQITGMRTTVLGQASEMVRLDANMEVRVWARRISERDSLSQDVIEYLRDNTLTVTTGFADQEMHDLSLDSSQPVDDPEPEGAKSMVLNFSFFAILGG